MVYLAIVLGTIGTVFGIGNSGWSGKILGLLSLEWRKGVRRETDTAAIRYREPRDQSTDTGSGARTSLVSEIPFVIG